MSNNATSKSVHPGLVMFALAMGGFAIGTTEFATMSLLPYFAKGLGIDEPTAGHVISAYALGVVVGAPAFAVIGARLSRKTMLIGLMILFAIGNGLSALAPTYGWLVAFRFLSGLPHGAYFGIAALVATTLVPPNRRATAVGRVMLGLTVATVIGVPVGELDRAGDRLAIGLRDRRRPGAADGAARRFVRSPRRPPWRCQPVA